MAALIAGIYAWRSQPQPAPLPPPAPALPSTSSPSPTPALTVDVTGKVKKPGVYSLPTGSRVTDALQAAGGLRTGATPGSINLARRLIDGEQIVVGPPIPGAQPAAPTDPATMTVDLNLATLDQLEELPGVGEVLASRILDFRTTHGGFHSIDQLREVSGIGPRKYEEIKPKVHV